MEALSQLIYTVSIEFNMSMNEKKRDKIAKNLIKNDFYASLHLHGHFRYIFSLSNIILNIYGRVTKRLNILLILF